jgi:hypothetical protein
MKVEQMFARLLNEMKANREKKPTRRRRKLTGKRTKKK